MAEQICLYQEWQKRLGLTKMDKSMNEISRKRGLSPATVYKWMMGKLLGLHRQLGGMQRGRVLTAGELQEILLLWNGLM